MTPEPPWQLDDVWMAWQPIVDLMEERVHGYEALARGPRGTPYELPAGLFASVHGERHAHRLEQHLRRLALRDGARVLPPDALVFVNVDSRWPDMDLDLAAGPLPPERVAIELTEMRPILENDAVLQGVARWRQRGHLIVIDDYGTGYAAAATVLALQPDLLKLDIRLVSGIDTDGRRQTLVESIRKFTADVGVRLVAEGVETTGELETVRELGVDFAQGFLLARPAAPPPQVTWPEAARPRRATVDRRHQDAAERLLGLYARSIQSANLPAYVVDRRRRIVGWNGLATRLTGHAPAQMVGHRCFEPGGLRHEDTAGRSLCARDCPVVRCMASAAPRADVVSLAARDGRRLVVRILATPIWDSEHGHVVGAVEQFEPVGEADAAALKAALVEDEEASLVGLGVDAAAADEGPA